MATELELVTANILRTQERINQMMHVSPKDIDAFALDAARRLLADLQARQAQLARSGRRSIIIQKTRVRYD